MFSGAGGGDTRRRRDLCPFFNLLFTSFFLCFPFYKLLEPFESYLLGLTLGDFPPTGDRMKRRVPATFHLLHPLYTGSTAKEKHASVNQATKIETLLIVHRKTTIWPALLHEISHWNPEKNMAKHLSELLVIIFEQVNLFSPIWSSRPPPGPIRGRVRNGETLSARMVSSLASGPFNIGPLATQLRPTNDFGPSLISIWPRYCFITLLSHRYFLMSLYFASMDRGRLSCLALTSKSWSCDYHILFLLAKSYWPPIEHVSLRILDLLFPLICRRHDCGNNHDSLSPSACMLNHPTARHTTSKLKHIFVDCKISLEESFHRTSLTAGYIPGPLLVSRSVKVSRTHGNSFLWVEISFVEKFLRFGSSNLLPSLFNLMFYLYGLIGRGLRFYLGMTFLNWLCEYLLQTMLPNPSIVTFDENFIPLTFCPVPARCEAMEISSTSQYLLIRTILHVPELLVNVFSTYIGLACDLVLSCACLEVPLDASSNYLPSLCLFHYAISFLVSSFVWAKSINFVISSPD